MKIRETRTEPTGFGGNLVRFECVRELADGEAVPEGAVEVTPETAVHPWQPVRIGAEKGGE